MTGTATKTKCRVADMWLNVLRRYLIATSVLSLIWEFIQLPLYTIWKFGTPAEVVFAAFHCTGRDVLIALCALIAALVLLSKSDWPERGYVKAAALALIFGVSYTIFSEWLNTEVRRSWSYSDLMPRLPIIGTGLSPLLQWVLVPVCAYWWARQTPRRRSQPATPNI